MNRLRRLRGDQSGVVAIVVALILTVLLGMGALVLDLSQVRADRQLDKSLVDSAVRAGLGVLQAGPWTGICRAANYLLNNSPNFKGWDSGSTQFIQLGSPLNLLTSSPCLAPLTIPYKTLCLPGGILANNTWGKFTATANNGRYTVEIDSGYSMPDPRFPEDQLASTDDGSPLLGGCDNLAIIITQKPTTFFGGVLGGNTHITTIRSVGRISELTDGQYNPAVLLLEPHGCSVLTVSGNGTRVISQPYLDHPGVIQIDSADDQGGCSSNQSLLNGQSTTQNGVSVPSIMACSATTGVPSHGCNVATGNNASRIGIYALNWSHPAGDYVTSGPGTYGDTPAVRSAQSGRGPVDAIYRLTVKSLDATANAAIYGNSGMPPGCTSVSNNTCTANGLTWMVLQQSDCSSLATFSLLHPLWMTSQNIYFNCNLGVAANNTPLTGFILSSPNAYVVVNGSLSISTAAAILDPRAVYVGGSTSGPKIGLNVQNGGIFSLGDPVPGATCLASGVLKYSALVVGNGSFNLTSGGAVHMCQTFTYLANGFNTVPATDATGPCTCSGSGFSGYTGNLSVGSGSTVDWTAPNEVSGRRPTAQELATTTPFEDLALWTEAGGSGNTVNGGGSSQMTGVYFMPNANSFSLAGNSGANVYLSAQFIARTMGVTGGAVVNLVLNPFDSVPFVIYQLALVR